MLHCVQRMPFGPCQNGGNHWYLILIKYHHDTSNCILKMFRTYKLFILYNGKKDVMFVFIYYVYNDVSLVYVG